METEITTSKGHKVLAGKYTNDEVLKAIKDCCGCRKRIQKLLGVSTNDLNNWINRSEKNKRAIVQARFELVDKAEDNI